MPNTALLGYAGAAAGRNESQRHDDLAARASADDAIITNGAAVSPLDTPLLSLPPHRHPFRAGVAVHGYGVPAAVALKRLYPKRQVISISGDGDFLMSGQEFATAMQYQLPIIALVLDNGMYGSIRLHQERTYPAAFRPPRCRIPISRYGRKASAALAPP